MRVLRLQKTLKPRDRSNENDKSTGGGGVEDQRRVKNGETERREDLNEEQLGRSLRSRGEKAFQRFHRALISAATQGDVKPAHDAGNEKASRQFVSGDLSRFVA